MVKFPQGKKSVAKEAVVMSRKVFRRSISTNEVSQNCSYNDSEMFLTTFGPAESNQDEINR